MSMLSAQCDELRSMAESVGLAMPQAATLMMEAADTIERLREQTEDMDFQLDKWQTKAVYFKQLADLAEADNAKLRELCVKALEWLRWAGGITCPPEVPDEFADELRELGVEVTA